MAVTAIFVGTPTELKALTSVQRSGAGGARVLIDPAGDGSLPPAWYFAVAGSTEAESAPTYYRFDDDTGTWYQGSGTGGGGGGSPTGAAGGDLSGTYPDPAIASGAVTDAKLGDRTVNQALATPGNTGPLTSLLSWITGRIKAITGTANWYDTPATDLAAVAAFMAGGSGGGTTIKYAFLQDLQYNVEGGDLTAGAFFRRKQNNETYSNFSTTLLITGGTNDGAISLPETGLYLLRGGAVAYAPTGVTQTSRLRFYNKTADNPVDQDGPTVRFSENSQGLTICTSIINVTSAPVVVQLEQRVSATVAINGGGISPFFGETNTNSFIEVMKIA